MISSNIRSAISRFDISGSSISPVWVMIVAIFVSVLNPAPSCVMSFATTISRPFLFHFRTGVADDIVRLRGKSDHEQPVVPVLRNVGQNVRRLLQFERHRVLAVFLDLGVRRICRSIIRNRRRTDKDVAFGNSFITASCISSAETPRITLTPAGGSTVVTPATTVTSAPRSAAASATANPIFPDE